MKVTLIAPPWYTREPSPVLSNNLGLASLAAVLVGSGHRVAIIDALAEGWGTWGRVRTPAGVFYRAGLSDPDLVARVAADTDWIGITVPFTTVARAVRELIPLLKQRFPRVPVVLGGVYPSTLPDLARTTGADYLVLGEGETAFQRLVAGVRPEAIPGVWGPAARFPGPPLPGELITDLDTLPFPARALLPVAAYFRHSPRGKRRRSLAVISSRGCPFECAFCSVHPVLGRPWRPRSAANVLAELAELIERYDLDHIEFEDDNLTLDRTRALAIFEGMTRLKKRLTWSSDNGLRIDTLDREVIAAMKASGAERVGFGIEHGDPAVLKELGKTINLARVETVVAECARAGIVTCGFFIVGHPRETRAQYDAGVRYFQRLRRAGLNTVAVHILKAYPGTPLYRDAAANGWLVDPDPETLRLIDAAERLRRDTITLVAPDLSAGEIVRRQRAAVRTLTPGDYWRGQLRMLRPRRAPSGVTPLPPWRIIHIPLKYAPALGGVERLVEQQCRLLARAGHEVLVRTTRLNGYRELADTPTAETREGVAIRRHRTIALPGLNHPLIPGLGPALLADDADLFHIHSFWYHNAPVARLVAAGRRIPTAFQPYYDPKASGFHRTYRALLGHWLLAADQVILISRYEEEQLAQVGLRPPRRVILPPAVDLDEFARSGEDAELIERYRLRDRAVYLAVGRVSVGKGLDDLVGLAERLRDRRSEAKVVVVGPDAGGRADYQKQVETRGLTEYLAFTGGLARPQLLALYRAAALFLHASRYEAFGIVLIEAMAAGVPIIAANTAAVPEVLTSEAGLMYTPGDLDDLERQIARVTNEPGLCQQLVRAAAGRVRTHYDLADYGRKLLAIYTAVVAGGGNRGA